MVQATDLTLSNQSGSSYRSEHNSINQALGSTHKGSSTPSYAITGMNWIDDSGTPWVWNVYDGTDDIPFLEINATANTVNLINAVDVEAAGSGGIIVKNSAGSTVATLGASAGIASVFEGNVSIKGNLIFPDKGELTISSGAITVTGTHHTIDTESDAASDDLDTINGGSDGMIIIIRAENTARTVVIKDGTGNIETPYGLDIYLDNTEKEVMLKYDGATSDWHVIASPLTSGSATDGQVLTADGAGGVAFEDAAGGGWIPLQTQTVSSPVSSVDFTSGIDSTYKAYAVVFSEVIGSSDNANLSVRLGNGGVFDSGASDYGYVLHGRSTSVDASGGSAATSSIILNAGVGNSTGESGSGVLFLQNPSGTSHTLVHGMTATIEGAPVLQVHQFSGRRIEAAAHDRIRFLFTSGNITAGTFTLYGLAGA